MTFSDLGWNGTVVPWSVEAVRAMFNEGRYYIMPSRSPHVIWFDKLAVFTGFEPHK
jgi:hypothetical protein